MGWLNFCVRGTPAWDTSDFVKCLLLRVCRLAEASKKYEELAAERDKVCREVERLREEITKASVADVDLEKNRLRVEGKIEEVNMSSEYIAITAR